MSMLFGVLSFFSMIAVGVILVILIVQLIRKKAKKKPLIALSVAGVVFIISVIGSVSTYVPSAETSAALPPSNSSSVMTGEDSQSVVEEESKVENMEYTLDAPYGKRSGTYSGDVVNGVPNGSGEFRTTNVEGSSWVYKGSFINGHFDGKGSTVWDSGQKEEGLYKNDLLNGQGKSFDADGNLIYEGIFIDGSPESLTSEEIANMITSPDQFKGRYVKDMPLKVFNIIGYSEQDGYQFQGWADKDNQNSVLIVAGTNLNLGINDYVLASGQVFGAHKSTNAFGAELTIAVITNATVDNADATIFNPSLRTIEVNSTQEQNGLTVTLQKIECAADSTRVFLKIENNTGSKAGIYSFNSYIVQDKKQLGQSSKSYDEDSIKSDMVNGTEQEGVLSFEPVNLDGGTLKIGLYAHCDDYNLKMSEYIFDVELGS